MKLIKVNPKIRPKGVMSITKLAGLLVGVALLVAILTYNIVDDKTTTCVATTATTVYRPSTAIVSRGGIERTERVTPTVLPTATPTPPLYNHEPDMNIKVFNTLDRIAKELELPREQWYPIAMYESRGQPSKHTVTSREDSRGIFQVNVRVHDDVNPSRLFDAEYNARYQMPELVRAYKQGKSLGIKGAELTKYVARYGQKPDWKDPKNRAYICNTIDYYYNKCP